MTRNVLTWLEATAAQMPQASAFADPQEQMSYGELKQKAQAIGSYIAGQTPSQQPVLLMMEKTPMTIAAMLGVVYAGCFYTPVDSSMPDVRLQMIVDQLQPALILADEKGKRKAESMGLCCRQVADIPDEVKEQLLLDRRNAHIDTDLLYVLFTSGSTGTPKGVAITHKSVVDFIEWACEALQIEGGSRFGNQAPLYFDNSVLDIYCSIRTGSCVYFLPKQNFMFPGRLVAEMTAQKIDTVFWVPSALTAVANAGVLENADLHLKRILFCGEVMPCRTLNIWRKAQPEAHFVNMYGPTEITDVCTWYPVEREFQDDESLPIGYPCSNTRIYLIDGEICVGGTCLAAGYWADERKTAAVFTQNPLRPQIHERIYHTGDLGMYNDRGELMFLGRKDSQIKRSGYRIELGEIETALLATPQVQDGCVLWDGEKMTCVYTGDVPEKQLNRVLKEKLPKYMLPDAYLVMEALPKTGNGKTDRIRIRQVISGEHPNP